jgi:hypothetical protein
MTRRLGRDELVVVVQEMNDYRQARTDTGANPGRYEGATRLGRTRRCPTLTVPFVTVQTTRTQDPPSTRIAVRRSLGLASLAEERRITPSASMHARAGRSGAEPPHHRSDRRVAAALARLRAVSDAEARQRHARYPRRPLHKPVR